jgi:succinate dehydrogenase / fumarate reductase membrane anchor subunit
MSLRTPLSRARGLGSAKEGADHFWQQRVTAVANLFLTIFLVYAVLSLLGADHATVKAFFASPITAVLMILVALSAAYHMRLGMQVVIEDYIHRESTKVLLLLGNTFFAIFIGLICVMSVIKLSLGA